MSGADAIAAVQQNDRGQYELVVESGDSVTVSQRLASLDPGTYAASVWVQIGGEDGAGSRPATLRVDGDGVQATDRTVTDPLPVNYVQANQKADRRFQRLRVLFDVTERTQPTVSLQTSAGSVRVQYDDVRIVPTERSPSSNHDYFQDFEHVDEGYAPFIAGPAGGTSDKRMHLSETNRPWTNDTINGDWSFKIADKRDGLEARTSPGLLAFDANRRYRVGFEYKAASDGYRVLAGNDYTTVVSQTLSVSAERSVSQRPYPDYETQSFEMEFETGVCGGFFVGFESVDSGHGMLVIDDFYVDDLGPVDDPAPACTGLEVASENTPLWPKHDSQLTTTFTNRESEPLTNVAVALETPEGWSATATDGPTLGTVGAGESVLTTWTVMPVADHADSTQSVTGVATYELDGERGDLATTTELTIARADMIPQWRLSIHDYDSADDATNGSASNAIDGDSGTLWHTAWSQVEPDDPYPHHIALDLGGSHQVDGLVYHPRPTGTTNGLIDEYAVYVSTDGQSWGEPVASGSFDDSRDKQLIEWGSTTGSYVKLVAESAKNGGPWAAVGELNVTVSE